MHNPQFVAVYNPREYLFHHPDQISLCFILYIPSPQQLSPFEVLGDNVKTRIVLKILVNFEDVRVIELTQDLNLLLNSLKHFIVALSFEDNLGHPFHPCASVDDCPDLSVPSLAENILAHLVYLVYC